MFYLLKNLLLIMVIFKLKCNNLIFNKIMVLNASYVCLHAFSLRNFFIHKIGEEEMFFQVQQRVIDFYSNSLLMELFVNCLESNNMTSIGNTPNGSMTMM
jgi:hypothetical protein